MNPCPAQREARPAGAAATALRRHGTRLCIYAGPARASNHARRRSAGDSQALPGHISVYLQITDPSTSTTKWDCFTSYRLCIENQVDPDKSVSRDSWHRFSPKKKSHGWCDFTPGARILDGKSGFCIDDAIVVSADILLLKEEYTFAREAEAAAGGGGAADVLAGKFTWRVHNISMFMEVMSLQKIMSPVFPAGDCLLRLSVYQSIVGDTDYLSMCLETKDSEKGSVSDKSCWCLFRMSVQSHREKGGQHMQRDSYGRFATDARTGDTTSLGWNDFMLMRDFLDVGQAFVNEDGTAIFCVSFHIIREQTAFARGPERAIASKRGKGGAAADAFQGKFTWRIEHFTRLKELLKKRKIASLCIKSKRFQVRQHCSVLRSVCSRQQSPSAPAPKARAGGRQGLPADRIPARPEPAADAPLALPRGHRPAAPGHGLVVLRVAPPERGAPGQGRGEGPQREQGEPEPVQPRRQGLGLARVRHAHLPLRHRPRLPRQRHRRPVR